MVIKETSIARLPTAWLLCTLYLWKAKLFGRNIIWRPLQDTARRTCSGGGRCPESQEVTALALFKHVAPIDQLTGEPGALSEALNMASAIQNMS